MRSIIGVFVLLAVISTGITCATQSIVPQRGFDSSDGRLAALGEAFSWILNPGYRDESQLMSRVLDEVAARASVTKLASVASPFTWLNTFNFTNSASYFGPTIMTSDEVGENLRNFMYQLLYGDIEAACEVSLLDIMLFRALDSVILSWINMSFSGFCNGIAQASRDYYLNPDLIPLGRHYAVQLPAPNPNSTIAEATHGDVTESAIKEYVFWKGSAAFFNPNHLLTWLKIFLGLTSAAGGTTNGEEFLKLTQAMLKGSPSYQPVVILMTAPWWDDPSPSDAHFVVVYDYQTNSNGSVTLYIYNNWHAYNSSSPWYDDWILLQSDGSFRATHRDPDKKWTRLAFYPVTHEYNSILTLLIKLLGSFASLGILSPVDVEITDPLGRVLKVGDGGVSKLEFPAIAVEDGGHKQILMPYLPNMPYTINLTGTGAGGYTMEINRVVDQRIVTQQISGNTTPGESDVYSMTLSSTSLGVSKQGVSLSPAQILSGSSVKLAWTKYNEPDFLRYEVLVSDSVGTPGDVHATINDANTTSAIISGLTPETTYFFSVRVVTTGGQDTLSNIVGASMPSEFTGLLLLAAAAGGGVVLLIVLVVWWRRRSS
jgi:hypothetical protein